jgi:hypothetical protein
MGQREIYSKTESTAENAEFAEKNTAKVDDRIASGDQAAPVASNMLGF